MGKTYYPSPPKGCTGQRLKNWRISMRDPKTRQYVLERRAYERFKNQRDPSHRMTTWRTEIRSPSGTERFYSVRNCRRCGLEELKHAAGHFGWQKFKKPCAGRR